MTKSANQIYTGIIRLAFKNWLSSNFVIIFLIDNQTIVQLCQHMFCIRSALKFQLSSDFDIIFMTKMICSYLSSLGMQNVYSNIGYLISMNGDWSEYLLLKMCSQLISTAQENV